MERKILDFLRTQRKPQTAQEIAKAIGKYKKGVRWHGEGVYRALNYLMMSGKIAKEAGYPAKWFFLEDLKTCALTSQINEKRMTDAIRILSVFILDVDAEIEALNLDYEQARKKLEDKKREFFVNKTVLELRINQAKEA